MSVNGLCNHVLSSFVMIYIRSDNFVKSNVLKWWLKLSCTQNILVMSELFELEKVKLWSNVGQLLPFLPFIGNSFGFVQFPKQNQYILQLLGR